MNLKELEKEILSSKKPVLLEIWSSWCPPCQAMKPTLEEFEQDYKDKVHFLKANPDLSPAVSSRYQIRGVPSFILFKDGKEVGREIGAKSKEELSKMIDKFFKKKKKNEEK